MTQTKRHRSDNEQTPTIKGAPTKSLRSSPNYYASSPSPCKKKRTTKRTPNKAHALDSISSNLDCPSNGEHVEWSEQEDSRLREGVLKHGGDWQLIREYIASQSGCYNHRASDCEKRWSEVVSKRHKKGPWTSDEDVLVCDLVRINGPKKWSTLATFVPGRTGKQCRERWVNHLSPDVNKGEWTPQEEDVLLREHKKLGNQWCKIALALPGRSENAVKNRWNSFANRLSNQQRAEYRCKGKSRGRKSSKAQSKGSSGSKRGKRTATQKAASTKPAVNSQGEENIREQESTLTENITEIPKDPQVEANTETNTKTPMKIKVKVKKSLTPLTIEPCMHTSVKADQYEGTDFDAVLMSPDISPMANTFSPVNVLSPVTSPSSLRGFQLSSLSYLWPNSPADDGSNKNSLNSAISRLTAFSDDDTKEGAEALASINEAWFFEAYNLPPPI